MHQPKPYRKCVGLVIINNSNKIFVGKRIDSNLNAWQMPQGGIEPGEDPLIAGLREMKEEIGGFDFEYNRETGLTNGISVLGTLRCNWGEGTITVFLFTFNQSTTLLIVTISSY